MSYTSSHVNYGYSVATNKTFVAVGNPSEFVYLNNVYSTGSVEVLQYSNDSDSYIHNSTIKKFVSEESLLATEASQLLTTELSDNFLITYGGFPITASKFGISVALHNNTLVIGDPLCYYKLTDGFSSFITASSVDIYTLSTISTASYVTSLVNTFETTYDYDTSFGESVSIYNDLIAVGASSVSSSKGLVYLYKNIAGTWTYHQTLTGSNIIGSKFGKVIKIDQSGSYSIIVGNGAISGSVYVFGYDSLSGYWTQSSILNANRNLTSSLETINNNWPPYITSSVNPDAFGNSVAIYGNNIVIGAPTDTCYAEYSGSTIFYQRGAVYFFESCTGDQRNWQITQKSFGSEELLQNNYFGWDVDLYNTSSIVTSLKTNFPFSSSYLQNTLYKRFDCNPSDSVYNILGQFVLFEKNTGSLWDVKLTLTKKKQYGEPYAVYGYDTSLYDTAIVVGAPVIYTGSFD